MSWTPHPRRAWSGQSQAQQPSVALLKAVTVLFSPPCNQLHSVEKEKKRHCMQRAEIQPAFSAARQVFKSWGEDFEKNGSWGFQTL